MTARMPDIAPTLTDTQVLEFCHRGYLILEGVVAPKTNERVGEFIRAHPYAAGDGGEFEDDRLLAEEWFVKEVILNRQAAGAVRSLLGRQAALPTWMFNHRSTQPKPAQQWHRDGCSRYGHAVNHLQVFYYPQDTPRELGPTEVLPGSHFLFNLGSYMGHYGGISGTASTAAAAGTIFITAYPIWHRRGTSSAPGVRDMLKYLYWRMAPPRRDWIVEPDFNLDDLDNFENALYGGGVHPAKDQFHHWHDAARMFYWLAGKQDDFHNFLGTAAWPMGHPPAPPARRFPHLSRTIVIPVDRILPF